MVRKDISIKYFTNPVREKKLAIATTDIIAIDRMNKTYISFFLIDSSITFFAIIQAALMLFYPLSSGRKYLPIQFALHQFYQQFEIASQSLEFDLCQLFLLCHKSVLLPKAHVN